MAGFERNSRRLPPVGCFSVPCHRAEMLYDYPYRAPPGPRREGAYRRCVSFQIVAIRTMATRMKLLPLLQCRRTPHRALEALGVRFGA